MLFRIKLPTKNSVDAYLYILRSGARGAKHLPFLKYIIMYWDGKVGSLWG